MLRTTLFGLTALCGAAACSPDADPAGLSADVAAPAPPPLRLVGEWTFVSLEANVAYTDDGEKVPVGTAIDSSDVTLAFNADGSFAQAGDWVIVTRDTAARAAPDSTAADSTAGRTGGSRDLADDAEATTTRMRQAATGSGTYVLTDTTLSLLYDESFSQREEVYAVSSFNDGDLLEMTSRIDPSGEVLGVMIMANPKPTVRLEH